MTFAKHASDRRRRAQIRPLRGAEPHPVQDLRRGAAGALVLSLPQTDAPARPVSPTWSSLTVKAATTLSYSAGHALPILLLGIFSWAVAEILAGCAAYAEAMYSPPAPENFLSAEPDATDASRGAKPSVSLMTMQVNDGFEKPTVRTDWGVSFRRVAAACWSSLRRPRDRRRAIAELGRLDDRSLRDVGIYRCDIEHIVRYGARRE